MLEAILLDRPLPGAGRAPAYGDRGFLESRPEIVLVDENLAEGLSLDGFPQPVRRLSRAELRGEAQRVGQLPYLRFAAPELDDGAVRLTLETHVASADPAGDISLGVVKATFRRLDGRWEIEGDAISVAN
jgi:hypothetical protein